MRCENCQSDVAAQVAEDGSIVCGNCGSVLDAADHPQLDEQLRHAEELLERWSREPLLEPLEPHPGKEASHLSEVEKFQAESESEPNSDASASEPESAAPAEPGQEDGTDDDSLLSEDPEREPSFEIELDEIDAPAGDAGQSVPEASKPKFRFDAAHLRQAAGADESVTPSELNEILAGQPPAASEPFDFDALDAAESKAEAAEADAQAETPAPEPPQPEPAAQAVTAAQPVAETAVPTRRIDAAQPVAVHSPPHLDIQQLIDQRLQEEKEGFNWMVFAGQWLSYLGVLGLTAGAALIVYGYFGGTTEMVPKGWMLTTAGQMLLLLGIVTLISGGLERANSEVNTRIQVLGEQMLRFERETKEQLLRGPKIPAGQYANDAQPAEAKDTADETSSS